MNYWEAHICGGHLLLNQQLIKHRTNRYIQYTLYNTYLVGCIAASIIYKKFRPSV